MPQIHFNGHTYNSLEEMPATERAMYDQVMKIFTDADKNGIPDIFEGDFVKNAMNFATTSFMVNGQSVQSLEGLPPDVRTKVDQAMKRMREMGLIPEGQPLNAAARTPDWDNQAIRPSMPLMQPGSVHSEIGTSRGLLFALAAIVLLVCAAAVVFLFFLQR